MDLTPAQIQRAGGVLLGLAAGDALGAGYEFGPPLPADTEVAMAGGGAFGWAPGQWTDDTDMALVIAQVLADGLDPRSTAAADRLAAGWWAWSRQSRDVGNQTRTVLNDAADRDGGEPTGTTLLAASDDLHAETGHTAGNGSLMRTAPVALAFLDDPGHLAEAACAVSALTHADPEAGEACVLWCLAIRHAVLTGDLDVRVGLDALPAASSARWAERLAHAETVDPSAFTRNGWVVEALQGAWSAISRTRNAGGHAADHLRLALEAAVRGGGDTDTVAAIAGGLLGAAYGASAVPASWRRLVHGWPGMRARDLMSLAVQITLRPSANEWPLVPVVEYWLGRDPLPPIPHPHDPGVLLGTVRHFRHLPEGIDAVVSLCRLGADEAPAPGVAPADHVEVWLIDEAHESFNPHLEFVFDDTVQAIADLRAEGRTVLLHCVQAQSRTPTLAALYSASLGLDPVAALDEIVELLEAHPNHGFVAAVGRRQRAGTDPVGTAS
jgi:ADP-ribosyl-[dinitrogen reductase] hydrolase